MEKDSADRVREDLRTIPKKELEEHFLNILAHCHEAGYNPFIECIPVIPAQHYFMGGIKVNHHSKTTMDALYVVGKTAYNGVHGRNRLTSNSLLESLAFTKRAAKGSVVHYETVAKLPESLSELDLEDYQDQESLEEDYEKIVLEKSTKQDQLTSHIVQSELREERIMILDPITLKLNVDPLTLSVLSEDINNEDVSTNSVMPEDVTGQIDLVCKEGGVICDLPIFECVFYLFDPATTFDIWVKDGKAVKVGQYLRTVRGDIRVLLSGERTAPNYLQRMSGIVTCTREIVELSKDSLATFPSSRKTTPNSRTSEEYTAKVGGGKNHRYNLSDGVLLKDNHIGVASGVKEAVLAAKNYTPPIRKIEAEVGMLEMVKEAVEVGTDIIMLDNMDRNTMKEAVTTVNDKAEIEISGNVIKENLASYIDLNVQYALSGAIIHSTKVLSLSPENLHPVDN